MKAIFDYESDNSVMRTKVALKVNLMKLMTNWKKVRRTLHSQFMIYPHKKVSQDLTKKKQDLTEMSIILMVLTEI